MVDVLPVAAAGLMLAAFAAAYMSTIGTQLNWGASYLVNDFYRRFIRPAPAGGRRSSRPGSRHGHPDVLSLVVMALLSSVEQAWKTLIVIGAGTGAVFLLRWFWWRINAWSEVSAMVASFVTSVALKWDDWRYRRATTPGHDRDGEPDHGRVADGHLADPPSRRRRWTVLPPGAARGRGWRGGRAAGLAQAEFEQLKARALAA